MEAALADVNIMRNDYQQDSKFFHTFVNFPKNFISLKAFNSEFSFIEIWLKDQNFRPLKIKGKKYYFSYISIKV